MASLNPLNLFKSAPTQDIKTIFELPDAKLAELVQNRWDSSATIADKIKEIYERNSKIYEGDPEWINKLPRKKQKTRTNRIFVDQEAVINTLIANPPKPNILPNRSEPEVQDVALTQEQYFNTRYRELNTKEIIRKGLRNLYFGRLIVLKPYWDPRINDFNVKSCDPTKVRMGKSATKEDDSEFFIEEIEEDVLISIKKFPEKQDYIFKQVGVKSMAEAMVKNPQFKYYEAWVQDYLCWKHGSTILKKMKNPYWDWQGLLITEEEQQKLAGNDDVPPVIGDARRQMMFQIKSEQDTRKQQQNPGQQMNNDGQPIPDPQTAQGVEMLGQQEGAPENLMADSPWSNTPVTFGQYYYNYFDYPRKPYIIATAFNNENSPIGRTDMITLASSLQESIDKRKVDISDNCELVNGWLKIEKTVMSKEEAEKLRFEAQGIVWGKGVINGVSREMGTPLPAMVFDDMQDSREEIDNIMAASSAFRGEREGTETKGGRLALVDQSYLRLNEYSQIVDYVCGELFGWWFQLAKLRYTEYHYAKTLGPDMGLRIMNLIQDDFIDGSTVRIIPGKTLPEDRVFKMQQAQTDMQSGIIAPEDYLQIAGYDDAKEKIRNAVMFKSDPFSAVGLPPPPPPIVGTTGGNPQPPTQP